MSFLFIYFSLHFIQLLILPRVCVPPSFCALHLFPSLFYLHTPSPTFSIPHSMYSLFTFVLSWKDLDKPNSSDPWYPVPRLVFPREWTNLMINSFSLATHVQYLTHTQTRIHTPNCHGVQRSAHPSCLQANYNATSPTTLSPPHSHVPPCFNLFPSTSFLCYIPHLEASRFITFNYKLCQRSPSYSWWSHTSTHSINPPTAVYPSPTC